MNELPEPFEILRGLNPVDPKDLRGAASAAPATEALERILADRRGRARTRIARIDLGWPRRPWVYFFGLLSLAALLAAAGWALTHGATTQLTVGCYASVDLQAHTVVVPAGDGSPIASCVAVWERGELGTRTTSPRLQACVLPSGAVGVFPSPHAGACRALGLKALATARSVTAQAALLGSVKNALVGAFLAKPCMNERQATATVRGELRKGQLNGWSVETEEAFGADRPCASLAFDEARHFVLLVPVPKHP